MSILFENFIKLLEGDVHKLIMELQTKGCKSDPIPMHILKYNLDSFLPVLKKLVNLLDVDFSYCWLNLEVKL